MSKAICGEDDDDCKNQYNLLFLLQSIANKCSVQQVREFCALHTGVATERVRDDVMAESFVLLKMHKNGKMRKQDEGFFASGLKPSPLATAVHHNKVAIAKCLVQEFGANPLELLRVDESGFQSTALSGAISNGNVDMVRALVEKRSWDLNENYTNQVLEDRKYITNAVKLASLKGKVHILRLLVKEYGADPCVSVAQADSEGCTAVHIASQMGQLEVLRFLVSEAGTAHCLDIADISSDEYTPLYAAAQDGTLETVKALVGLGADPNRARFDGITPVQIAARHGQSTVVKWLVNNTNAAILYSHPQAGTAAALARGLGQKPRLALWLESKMKTREKAEEGEVVIPSVQERLTSGSYLPADFIDPNYRFIQAKLDIAPDIMKANEERMILVRKAQEEKNLRDDTPGMQPILVRCRNCYLLEDPVNKFQRCSQCMEAQYCSRACQKKHWRKHKLVCRKPDEDEDVCIPPGGFVFTNEDFLPRPMSDAMKDPEMQRLERLSARKREKYTNRYLRARRKALQSDPRFKNAVDRLRHLHPLSTMALVVIANEQCMVFPDTTMVSWRA